MHRPKRYMYGTLVLTSGNQGELATNTFEDAVNVHGLRGHLSLFTETSSAIIGVNWALACMPAEVVTSVNLALTDANMNDNSLQSFIWLSGKAIVHRENITEIDFNPMTSRSCPENSFMTFVVRYENAIAGTTPNLRAGLGMTWWETQI